jgi:ABC-type multidrug transport system permease subunit
MKRITIFLAILLIAYLSGAFYSTSFNIAEWEAKCRAIVVILGLFSAISMCISPFIDEIFK